MSGVEEDSEIQLKTIVDTQVSSKLEAHDNMIAEMSKQMSAMIDEMEDLHLVQGELVAEEKAEAREARMKVKKVKEEARKKKIEMHKGREMDPEEDLLAELQSKKKKKKKKKKLGKDDKELDDKGRRRTTKLPQAAADKKLSIESKPRGRIVGKVVEQTFGGVEVTKKKSNQKLTAFNAPRCASVGKGSLEVEKQREAQAMSQVKYPHCRSVVYAPAAETAAKASQKGYNPNEKPAPAPAPDSKLEIDFVHGYHNSGFVQAQRNNTFYLKSGEIVYPSASLVIIYNQKEHKQNFFKGHSDEVSSLVVHPNGRFVASSQGGRFPPIFVWDSAKRVEDANFLSDSSHLATLNGHEARVCSVDFSHDGKLLVSVSADTHNTAVVWDWKAGTALTSHGCGSHPVFDMRFNPYQAYGLPDNPPLPGQASNEDDAIYTLTSSGVRHIKFWVLLRSLDDDSESMRWYLEGNSVNYAQRTTVQDIVCFDFIDDSPELSVIDAETGRIQRIKGSTDRSQSRVVAGTSDGDIFVFKQPEVKLRYGAGNRAPKPWWIVEEASKDDNVIMKRLWDSFATIVGIVPHSVASGNRYILARKQREEIDRLTAKLRLQSHNSDLKKRLEGMYYNGPLGHGGGACMVVFSKATNLLITSGGDGRMRVWDPNVGVHERDWGVATTGGLEDTGDEYGLKLNEILHSGAAGRSISWPKSGSKMVVGTSTNSILEVKFDVKDKSFGRVNELVSSHFGTLSGLAVHPTKNVYVTVGKDKSVNLWLGDANTCASQARLSAPATSVCFHESGEFIAVGLTTFEFVVLRVEDEGNFSYKLKKNFQKHVAHIKQEDADIATTDKTHDIKDDRGGGRKGGGRGAGLNRRVSLVGEKSEMAFSGVTGEPQNTVSSNSQRRREGRGSGQLKDEVMDLKYSPSGSHLAIALRDNNIYIYQISSESNLESDYKLMSVMKGHTSMVTNIDWSADSVFLQSTGGDAELLYWQIQQMKNEEKDPSFKPCQFAHPFLLRDKVWKTWTSIYGWPVQGIWPGDIKESSEPVRGVMRSNRGEVLLVADDAARVRLQRWPSLPGDKVREYYGHAMHCKDAKFSVNDSSVISIGGGDCTIIQWKHVDGHGKQISYVSGVSPRRPTAVRTPRSSTSKRAMRRTTTYQTAVASATPIQEETTRELKLELPKGAKGGGEKTKKKAAKKGARRSSKEKEDEVRGGGGVVEEKKEDGGAGRERRGSRGSAGVGSRRGSKEKVKVKEETKPVFPKEVVALYDYSPEDEEELTFMEGDVLAVFSEDDGWYSGKSKEGGEGILPANYVKDR